MSQAINLLRKRQLYKHKEKIFAIFRLMTVVFGGFCVGALVMMFYLKTNAQLKNKALLGKKEQYLTELLTKKDVEKQVLYFNDKSIAFDKILKEDVNFLPYYRLLSSRLPTATGAATLSDVTYNNKGEVSFALTFPDYNSFYNVLNDFQNQSFLNIFEKLSLGSFKVGNESGTTEYKISLQGNLEPIKDEKIN